MQQGMTTILKRLSILEKKSDSQDLTIKEQSAIIKEQDIKIDNLQRQIDELKSLVTYEIKVSEMKYGVTVEDFADDASEILNEYADVEDFVVEITPEDVIEILSENGSINSLKQEESFVNKEGKYIQYIWTNDQWLNFGDKRQTHHYRKNGILAMIQFVAFKYNLK